MYGESPGGSGVCCTIEGAHRRAISRFPEAIMEPGKPVPHATADDMDEPVGRDESTPTPSEDTKQRQLDEREMRTHEVSENELPSSQEKNPVPPESRKP
jgi:hypothetical protein